MAITIDWNTRIISVPKADLTLVQSTPFEVRQLNLNDFRLALKDLEDSEEGMTFPDTHRHNTEVLLGSLTFARVVEIINGYTITFEDGQYAVDLIGANSNVGDNINLNQVSVRSYNSAGLISNTAMEYSSFSGGVWVDVLSSSSGTLYPVGTPQMPVNNMADASLIATFRGLNKFYIIGEIVLDADYNDVIFEGPTGFTIDSIDFNSRIYSHCIFKNMFVTGVMDAASHDCVYDNCFIEEVTNIQGEVFGGRFKDNVLITPGGYLSGVNIVVEGDFTVIDLRNTTGTIASFDVSSGFITFINSVDGCLIELNLRGGDIEFSDTCTGGEYWLEGYGKVYNYSSMSEKANILISVDIEWASFNGGVSIDIAAPYNDIIYPTGTPQQPTNNFADALLIAAQRGFETIYVIGDDVTLDDTLVYDGFTFIGESNTKTKLTLPTGADVSNCEFYDMEVTGVLDGGNVLKNCAVENLNYINGYITSCVLKAGTITLGGNNEAHFFDCWAGTISPTVPNIDLGGSGQGLAIRNYNGGLRLLNKTGPENVTIDMNSGLIILDSTITAGELVIRGVGTLQDGSTGTATVQSNDLLNGENISRVLGLSHENIYIDNTTFDSNSNMTAARVRIYSNPDSVGTVNDIIGTYIITAVATGPGTFSSWKQVQA